MARNDPSQLIALAQSLARQAPAQTQMPDYGADINSINRDYALADALASQQYIPDSGWLGALAQIASAGAGAWKASKADKRAAELTKRMNTDAQGAQQAEAERQAAARAQQIQQIAEAYKIDPQQAAVVADGLGKARDFAAPAPGKLPGKLGEWAALQELPPEAQAAFKGYLAEQRPAAPVVNVNTPPRESAFGRELGKRDAGLFADQRNKAISAQQAMNSIDGLDKILSNTATGKSEELYGQLAQWVGAPEGADFQATNALVNERVFELINALKGPATDKDAERAQAQIPNMGTDPRARAVVFDYLRKKAGTDIQMYGEMEDWLGKGNQSFNGFRPSVGQFSVNTSALGGEGGSVGGDEPVAVNDRGEKLVFRNGRWVHMK